MELAVSAILVFISLIGAIYGYGTLIRDVNRGYSPQKTSLVAVLLLLGTFPAFFWAANILAMLAKRNVLGSPFG